MSQAPGVGDPGRTRDLARDNASCADAPNENVTNKRRMYDGNGPNLGETSVDFYSPAQ